MCTCCWWLLVVYLSGCWEKHEKQLNLKRRLFNAGLIVLSTALQWDEVHLKKRQFASESLRAWEGLRHPIHCSCLLLFWEQCTCLAQSPAPILAPTNPHVSSTNRGVWALSCSSKHWTRLHVKHDIELYWKTWCMSQKVILDPASLQLQTLSQQCNFLQQLKFHLPFIGLFKDTQSSVCSKVLKLC